MTEPTRPQLTINERILDRIFQEVNRTPDLEIGGRFFGRINEDGSLEVDDFIPTGPEPDSVSAIELLPDRRYQLWTLDKLRTVQHELDLFGSWHSHIPNGLERFSRQDHHAYHSRMRPPYPHSGMLCGLIHTMPSSPMEVKEHLMLAWFPANSDLGVHSFYSSDETLWTSSPLQAEITDLIHLTDHRQYHEESGRIVLTLNDWHRAIHHIADGAVDAQHEIRTSPDNQRLLVLENNAGQDGYAMEISADGSARCYFDEDEPTEWMEVGHAAHRFEQRLLEWFDLPTEWSHLNRTLATVLVQRAEKSAIDETSEAKPKRPWYKRILGR
jgi:proteasome lid subunit RPN8/RPN11